MLKKIVIFVFILLLSSGIFYHKTFMRLYEGFQLAKVSKERAKYYVLDNGLQLQDITQKIILDKSVPLDLKQPLIDGDRRIVIFKYLSDGQYVAGYYSYIPTNQHPVMIFLRGGNGYFGIMRPNNRFSFLKDFNIVGTLYRGNIYDGVDQFGGEDIHDVENLIKFFPQLEKFTNTKMRVPFSMMGVSRGAMEMFASLSRSSYVKDRVSHAIAVSGNLDLNVSMKNRPEMKYMFQKQFNNSHAKDFSEWVNMRDPIYNVKNLSKSLKVLLIYGLSDNRVCLEEQKNFKMTLYKERIDSHLITIPGGNHGLNNKFEELENIVTIYTKESDTKHE